MPGRAALESAETVVTPDASNGFVLLTDGQAAARACGPVPIGGGLGVVYARRGKAMLMTATRSGGVTVAVRVSNRDAGPDRDFPDIVEIDFVARTTDLDIIDPSSSRPPDLPDGTGAYRLAYHGRGLDSVRPSGAPADNARRTPPPWTRPASTTLGRHLSCAAFEVPLVRECVFRADRR